jgi:hypothetical protein
MFSGDYPVAVVDAVARPALPRLFNLMLGRSG